MTDLTTLSMSQLLDLYRTMLLIRRCEEALARAHQGGLIPGPCHTYVGEEAVATGVCRHEFLFKQASNGVLVTSRETFRGLQLLLARRTFPRKTIRELTINMLQDLKKAAEKEEPAGGRGDGETRGTGKAEHE